MVFLHTPLSRWLFCICNQTQDLIGRWRGEGGRVHEGDPGYLKIGREFISGGQSLTVEKEAKGKTGIEDGSLNLTWETIYLLAVQLVYTIQALIPEQYLVDFAAVKSGFSKKKYFGT